MPDIKLSQLPSASPATAAEGARLWTGKGHIDGLRLEWVSGTSLRVTSGMAYIESLGYAIDVPAAITKSSLSLTASTWYHVYLFDNAGTPDIEVVTTAPDAPYSGAARSKAADDSRRYIGSVLTNSSSSLRAFKVSNDYLSWTGRTGIAPNHILANGTATTQTNVSPADVVPVTCSMVMLRAVSDSSVQLNVSNSEAASFAVIELPPGREIVAPFPLDSSGELSYLNTSAPTTGANLYVLGYFLER